MSSLRDRIHQVRAQLAPQIRLLAVSKTTPAQQVQAAWDLGLRAFGENYVQEALSKIEALKHLKPDIEWHLIGPLQSNKTAAVAQHFDWVQTLDRLKIGQRLNEQRPAHLPPLNVCLQVNIDGGANKSGIACSAPHGEGWLALTQLADALAQLPRLRLRGLLIIPEPQPDFESQRTVFAKAKQLFDALNQRFDALNQRGCALDTLSMGMSADYAAAIAAGSTMVRIGSALFGQRQYAA